MEDNSLELENSDIEHINEFAYDSLYYKDLPPERKTFRVNLAAILRNPNNFKYTPEEAKTDILVFTFLEMKNFSTDKEKSLHENLLNLIRDQHELKLIKHLPERLRTEEIYLELAKVGIWYLPIIPKDKLTKEMCMLAVQKEIHSGNKGRLHDPLNCIQYPEVLLEFLKTNGKNLGAFDILKAIKPDKINTDIANESIQQDLRCFTLIPDGVPHKLPTMTDKEKNAIVSIAQDINAYPDIPEDERTELVSFVAVKAYGELLKSVPEQSLSRRIIFAALNQDGGTIKSLKPEIITHGMLVTALKNIDEFNGGILGLFPLKMRTYKRCLQAVESSPFALEFIPENYRDQTIWETAVKYLNPIFHEYGYEFLRYINSSDIFLQLLPRLSDKFDLFNIIQAVPQSIINKEIAEWIIAKEGSYFGMLPKALQSEELFTKALKQRDYLIDEIQGIRPELLTYQILEKLVKTNRLFFHRLPSDMKTPELCVLQQHQHPEYMKHYPVPEQIKNTNNVYSIYSKILQNTGFDLSLDQIQKIMSGEKLACHNKEKKITVIYTPESHKLKLISEFISIETEKKERKKALKK